MRDMIEWLLSVETRARDFYRHMAEVFAADPEFADFLQNLAGEEAEHIEFLGEFGGAMAAAILTRAPVIVDPTTRHGITVPFDQGMSLLEAGNLSPDKLLEIIADLEFSEWNELFLYVVKAIKEQGSRGEKYAAVIDRHRGEIEEFLITHNAAPALLERIRRMPPVWEKRILVVEDDAPLAFLLKNLLQKEAEIVLAEDGEKGLECLRQGYFDGVVCDVEMPVRDGIELFRAASVADPTLGERWVFFSGTRNTDQVNYIKSNHLRFLRKPCSISEIRRTIAEIVKTGAVQPPSP